MWFIFKMKYSVHIFHTLTVLILSIRNGQVSGCNPFKKDSKNSLQEEKLDMDSRLFSNLSFPLINQCYDSVNNVKDVFLTISQNLSVSKSLLRFKFSHLISPLSCPNNNEDQTFRVSFELTLSSSTITFFKKNRSSSNTENPFNDGTIQFLPSGKLKYSRDRIDTFYNPSEFCLSRLNRTHMEATICLTSCVQKLFHNNETTTGLSSSLPKEVCVPKCCNPDQVMDFTDPNFGPSCQNVRKIPWTPQLYSASSLSQSCISRLNDMPYRIQRKGCTEVFNIIPATTFIWNDFVYERSSFRLLDDGRVAEYSSSQPRTPLKLSGLRWVIHDNNFCIDGMQNFENSTHFYYDGHPTHQFLFICHQDDPTELSTQTDQVYMYISAMYLSLIPLALTIGAYWFIDQNIHGWTIFSQIVTMFLLNLFLGTAHLLSTTSSYPLGKAPTICKIVGILAHFFFLSTFFWLSVVNLDVWLTFKNLKPTLKTGKGVRRRYLTYAIWGWGGPLVIVIVGLVLDKQYADQRLDSDCHLVLPHYGYSRCYLEKEAEGLYSYFPIGILIVLNLFFFVATMILLFKYRRGTRSIIQEKSKADITLKELFTKLFIVMGISFVFEFISWAYLPRSLIVAIIDFLNIFVRALCIFFIFVCKRRTLMELKKKGENWRWLKFLLNKRTREVEGSNELKVTSTQQNSDA